VLFLINVSDGVCVYEWLFGLWLVVKLLKARNSLTVWCYIMTMKRVQISIHSLIPWSTVLLEKLTGLQLVKKFPAFYGTRRFIIAVTSTCHLSLS
jgi:hypothetical protein